MNEALKQHAKDLGFENLGIISLTEDFPESQYFLDWLARGDHAGMDYLEKRQNERLDIQKYFAGAKSAIVCSMFYAQKDRLPKPARIKIARYARGRDYHIVFKKRLQKLARFFETEYDCQTRVCVDTAPVLDRVLAFHAGLGWFGKNTCLIDRKHGSYFFIGSILTDASLPSTSPMETDHCGTCRRCLDACPTGAFTKAYVLDARKCLSYWNIEHRGDIPQDIQEKMNGWLFGCDICQEVCPWNQVRDQDPTPLLQIDPAYAAMESADELVNKIKQTTKESFSADFAGRPLKRARFEGLKRNVKIVVKGC